MKTTENSASTGAEKSKTFSVRVSIPRRSVYSFLGLIGVLSFTMVNFKYYLIPGFKEIFSSGSDLISLTKIGLIYIPLISYCLIGVMIALVVNLFKPLKLSKKEGLIGGLIVGLICELIFGLMGSVLGGLLAGQIAGLVLGLIAGLLIGLVLGLVIGLLAGLFTEF